MELRPVEKLPEHLADLLLDDPRPVVLDDDDETLGGSVTRRPVFSRRARAGDRLRGLLLLGDVLVEELALEEVVGDRGRDGAGDGLGRGVTVADAVPGGAVRSRRSATTTGAAGLAPTWWISTSTSGRMPASSHASRALSTPSFTVVSRAFSGLSNPRRCRF